MPIDRTPAGPDLPAELDEWPAGDRPADGDELSVVAVRDAGWAELSVAGLRLDEVEIAGGDLAGSRFVDPSFRDVVISDANLANVTLHGGILWRGRIGGGRLTRFAGTRGGPPAPPGPAATPAMGGFRAPGPTRGT